MTSIFRPLIVAGAIAAGVGLAASALAHTATAQAQSPRYDLKTETTIAGLVVSVETDAAPRGRGRRSLGGTHLVLQLETGTVEVHLGPSAYLKDKKVDIARGDLLVVLGSKIAIDNEPVFIAREIKKADHVWTLRDRTGRPLWSGRAPGAADR